VTVVATSYLLGVSTRRMEKLVKTLGITRLSKSQISEMAKDLDAQVEALPIHRSVLKLIRGA
jgi:putative transposase